MKPAFTPTEIPRSKIKTAEYNPRTITDGKKKRLWALLDKHGLVEPLVWNKRTGNLVGGHQRLEWLDSKHPDSGGKHPVPVAQIDISLAQEKALNVALNNTNAQGEFGDAKLSALLKEIGEASAAAGTGFDDAEIEDILNEAETILQPVDPQAPPKMAWVLIGIPLGRFGEIVPHVEALAALPGVFLETTASDHGAPQT